MLMLLSVHVTNVLFFLVQFNNFALTMGVTRSYLTLVTRSYALLLSSYMYNILTYTKSYIQSYIFTMYTNVYTHRVVWVKVGLEK